MAGGRWCRLLAAGQQLQGRDIGPEAVGDRGGGQVGQVAEGGDAQTLQQIDRPGEVQPVLGTGRGGRAAVAPAGADGGVAQGGDRMGGEVLGAAVGADEPAARGGQQGGEGAVGDADGGVPAGEVGDRVDDPLGQRLLPTLVAGGAAGGHQQHAGSQHVHARGDGVDGGGDQFEQGGLDRKSVV